MAGQAVIDIDIRALQVKRMDEPSLTRLHHRETEQGYRMLPWEIAKMIGGDIKAFYGVPLKKPATIRAWAGTVRQVLGRFLREMGNQGAAVSMEDLAALHAFDDAVWRSDLDFHFRTATPAKRAKEWFQP